MKSPTIAALLMLALAASAPARAAGRFEASAGAWVPDITGTLRNGVTYDLERDLGIDADAQRQFSLYYGFKRRWYWPDLSGHFDHIGAQGNGRSSGTAVQVFGTQVIPTNSLLYSTVSINDYDASLDIPFDVYGVHVGAGVTVKYLVGNVTVNTLTTGNVAGTPVQPTATSTVNRLDEVFPLGHLRVSTDLASWLSLVAAGNYIQYDGDRVYELRGQADVRPLDPITLSVGYQRKAYKVSRGSYLLDADVDGLFFGVGLVIR